MMLTAASAGGAPAGQRLAFSRGLSPDRYDIWTTHGTPIDQWPAWSPDGKIVFERGVGAQAELYLVNATGTGMRRLTHNRVADDAPAWSPDGTRIVFSRKLAGRNRLMLMRADGTGQRSLRGIPGGEPAWSPDGARLAFAPRSARGGP